MIEVSRPNAAKIQQKPRSLAEAITGFVNEGVLKIIKRQGKIPDKGPGSKSGRIALEKAKFTPTPSQIIKTKQNTMLPKALVMQQKEPKKETSTATISCTKNAATDHPAWRLKTNDEKVEQTDIVHINGQQLIPCNIYGPRPTMPVSAEASGRVNELIGSK